MGRHRRHSGQLLAAGTAALLATGAISASADHARHATASASKGSSCAHPYEAHFGQPKLSPWETLLGDTHYIFLHFRELPRGSAERAPLRRSYSWGALHGLKMCRFHVWVTKEYRVGESTVYEKAVTLETPLDSYNPHGGRNVVALIKDRCGRLCGERDGYLKVNAVLTAAR